MRLVELEHLVVPGTLDDLARADAARRLLTLLTSCEPSGNVGGTGKAIRARNCLGEPLCLKSLRAVPRFGVTEDQRQRVFSSRAAGLAAEYACQGSLRGIPGIPRVYGMGTYGGGPVILMEWVQGRSLREVFLAGRGEAGRGLGPDAPTLVALGATIAGTLCAARVRDPSFVHRDLSGTNVLLCERTTSIEEQVANGCFDLRVIDFGSARCLANARDGDRGNTGGRRLWRNATPEYAPPEMLTHDGPALVARRGSDAIDSYELCGVLYELYCGNTPYQLAVRQPRNAFLYKVEHRPPVPELRCRQDAPFVELIMRGLSCEQALRPSMSELYCRLQELCRTMAPGVADRIEEHYVRAVRAARRPAPAGSTDLSPCS